MFKGKKPAMKKVQNKFSGLAKKIPSKMRAWNLAFCTVVTFDL